MNETPRLWWKNTSVAVVLMSGLLFLAQAIWLSGFSIDDAGISWRYAAHLGQGLGLRWNLEGSPVEGYSNFLWVLMLAGLKWLGIEVAAASQILGAAIALVALWLLALLARRIWRFEDWWWTPVVIVVLTPEWAMWTMSGLEQALVAVFVLLATLALTTGTRINAPLLATGLAGLTLSRPEGVAVSGLFLGAWVVIPHAGSTWGLRARQVIWPAIVLAIVAGGILAFRYLYFGRPMPNTVYAKFSTELPSLMCVIRWLLFVMPFLLAAVVALLRSQTGGHRKVLLIGLIVVLGHSAMTLPVSTVMNFDHRYHIPFLPLLLLCVPALIDVARTWRRPAGIALTVALCLWSMQGAMAVHERVTWERERVITQRCTAEQLRALPGKPTVAINDAGRIPYWTDLQYIDVAGLCDPEFAGKFSPDLVLAREPNVYVVSADSIVSGFAAPRLGVENVLYDTKVFPLRYRLWNHCVIEKRKLADVYDYAILVDIFWAGRNGVRVPEAWEFE